MKKTTSGNRVELEFDFSEIERIELKTINSKIKDWYAKQTDKPDYVINGTLFTYSNYAPIGTVIIDGVMVQNQGNGYGIGLGSDNVLRGGKPWERRWKWYYTGFPPLAVNKEPYVAKGFDSVEGYTKRTAVGIKDNKLYVISDKCTIDQLRNRYNLDWLMNNDGGGSSYIMEYGTAINKPTENRKIANVICIWLKRGDTLKGKAKCRLSVYNASGVLEKGRYIDKGDIIEIGKTITDNLLIEVEYPLLIGGTRKAYLKSLDNVQKV